MNVLSLFDGISCGQIALDKLGKKVDHYFASEIDRHAIKVTQSNFPKTVQVGNVEFVTKQMLNCKIDLLIGGSPCQGFSLAGKQLNFDDPRSKLFFEFTRLKRELNPKYFFLENVRMKRQHQDVISKYLGREPIAINSGLVSAQNRLRYYWTNIPNITQPSDKGILLRDIVEDGLQSFGLAQRGRYDKEGKIVQKYELNGTEKSNAITTVAKDSLLFVPVSMNPTHKLRLNGLDETQGVIRKLTRNECERLQTVPDDYTIGISEAQARKALGNGWTIDVISHVFKNVN